MNRWILAVMVFASLAVLVGAAAPRFSTSVANDVVCTNCIGPIDIAADAVLESELNNTVCLQILIGSGDQLTTAGATHDYIGFHDLRIGSGDSQTEADVDTFITPAVAVVNNLRCTISTAPTANDTWVFTVRDGARESQADTAVTCTITGASDIDCDDLVNSEAIIQGSTVTVKVDSSTGSADPAASGVFECSVCVGQ